MRGIERGVMKENMRAGSKKQFESVLGSEAANITTASLENSRACWQS